MKLFRRKDNRLCINFDGYGLVPLADLKDDYPSFITKEPTKIGDDAIVFVEGTRRKVRLLESSGHVKNAMYLVDMGSA